MRLGDARRSQPPAADVAAARAEVQEILGVGMTAARDWCANELFTTRRAFQQWEDGFRRMHPAMWRLLEIKLAVLRAGGDDQVLAEIGRILAKNG
jgi:hypothetical protein